MAYEALYTRGRPKNLSHLVGQEHISNALTRAISNGRLSHAYLLVGTRGTGKTSTARLLAKAMNCDKVYETQNTKQILDKKEIPCNTCEACRSFGTSSDNVEFDAASNRSVEDVTRLLSTAYFAPLRARVKTFIIDEVHMLSFEAVNSILKLIEEPPPNVAFFLATTEVNKVPMTIRSRCQILNFRLIPSTIIAPYLLKLARRLEINLQEDAAKKIARLANGSMRDALSCLDRCYSMADKEITLESVNETLGLISDENLDETISAIKSGDRKLIGGVIAQLFQSGLSANLIAEALITRLRDIEFEMLARGENDFTLYDEIIMKLRKAINEMYGSGIPDIILEMTLLGLARPLKLSSPQVKKLDISQETFYDAIKNLAVDDNGITSLCERSMVKNFSDDSLEICFKSKILAEMFRRNYLSKLEQELKKITERSIRLTITTDENLILPIPDKLSESGRSNLKNAMSFFHSNDIIKLND